MDEEPARDLSELYYVGRKVDVYYNPNDPHEAVLEVGARSANYVEIISGILVLSFSIWWCRVLAKEAEDTETE